MRHLFLAALASLWMVTLGAWAQGQSSARLLLDSTTVSPGSSFQGLLELTAPTGWHTYWRNPGESGQRTRIDWTLPEGITVSPVQWPTPRRLTEAGLTTYVYDDQVSFPFQFTVSASQPPGAVTLKAKVSWLECKTECLPGQTNLTLTLQIGTPAVASPHAARIAAADKTLPARDSKAQAAASWSGPANGDERPVQITSPETGFEDFFPYESKDYDLVAVVDSSSPGRRAFNLTKLGDAWPKSITGLLMLASAGGPPRAVEMEIPLGDASATPVTTTGSSPTSTTAESAGLLAMLGLAFVGGLILNIMPCVLPVIALKILGFVNQSREQPGRVRFLGLVYTAGVLASFSVLAGLVIAVQAAGQDASWGMQFQNPIFLVAITTLVTLVALNLFGVFEVTLHSGAMGAASDLSSRKGPAGAFFNGVFTTILATPCTAPFLGVALGFAFGQPPVILLLLFLVAGLGLAAPYLLLSFQPAWLGFLPKPGNWMITFKTVMGFPMAATALWLLSLAPYHFGESGVFLIGLFLVCVSLAAWIFGQYIQTGQGHVLISWATAVAALVLGYVLILERELHWRNPPPLAASTTTTTTGGIAWKPWSPAAIEEARAAGHPVLVDFTAEWCLTCKVNKKIAIDIPSVREQINAQQVTTLRGDYTRKDPAIAAELRRFERAGVPLVLVYPKNPTAPPEVLPTQLTPGIVLEALQRAVQ